MIISKTYLYTKLFQPHSLDQDQQRREFIVNILVSGLTTITAISLVSSVINQLSGNALGGTSSLAVTFGFLIVMAGLWYWSRHGGYLAVSYLFVGALALISWLLMLEWSFELPAAELLYALTIVIAGVLLSTKVSLAFTGLGSGIILLLGYLQSYGVLHPRLDWLRNSHIEISDAIGYVVLLAITGVVSWLSNREIERSLARAWASEAALEKERDNLEVKVKERTLELEQLQLRRSLEQQRLAEFGRLSVHLIHEVANPLTAASLNLRAAKDHGSDQILQARKSLRQLERYLQAARKQVQGESKITVFSVRSEFNQIIRLLQPRSQAMKVTLICHVSDNPHLRGDVVKFNQLVTNLLANAIEAYDGSRSKKQRQVTITAQSRRGRLIISVVDNGKGIPKANLAKIFDPFYTTKLVSKRGMGIGLAMVKQFVDEDFGGSIAVSSQPRVGTTFELSLQRLTSGRRGL